MVAIFCGIPVDTLEVTVFDEVTDTIVYKSIYYNNDYHYGQ